ncbi:Hypothetical protein A7982_01495 [Minicystis rosea]|nr:Hypothetical protein A7982_01495 [Minicystis rosea]
MGAELRADDDEDLQLGFLGRSLVGRSRRAASGHRLHPSEARVPGLDQAAVSRTYGASRAANVGAAPSPRPSAAIARGPGAEGRTTAVGSKPMAGNRDEGSAIPVGVVVACHFVIGSSTVARVAEPECHSRMMGISVRCASSSPANWIT